MCLHVPACACMCTIAISMTLFLANTFLKSMSPRLGRALLVAEQQCPAVQAAEMFQHDPHRGQHGIGENQAENPPGPAPV